MEAVAPGSEGSGLGSDGEALQIPGAQGISLERAISVAGRV